MSAGSLGGCLEYEGVTLLGCNWRQGGGLLLLVDALN